MVFSSFIFVFGFLPIFLASYFLTPRRFKNLCILIWSYLFYAWGAPKIVLLLLLSSAADYLISKRISQSSPGRKKACLSLGILLNIGLLGYYKYANFFVAEFNRLLGYLETPPVTWAEIALPIGISFFTFQKISYLVDVYRQTALPAKNIINYLLYVVSFPQLIAGPIVRYHDVSQQIENRRHSPELLFSGAYRFCIGLGKKVLIADPMGNVASNVLKLDPSELTTSYAWLGIVCYAYQIYFDFSAYSDMAIGLGRMMGFRFLENFDRPYISQNITEFWRRWHISLSRWMKDYLYIPLGGNRVSPKRLYFNLWIVFLLSGLWHGAAWTFVIWGAIHGLLLSFDKLFWLEFSNRLGRVTNTLLTFLLVCISWVFFRSDSLQIALDYLARMFNPYEYWTLSDHVLRATVIHDHGIFILILASLICFLPTSEKLSDFYSNIKDRLSEPQITLARFAASAACILLSALAVATTDYAPFIYFRF